MLNQFGLVECEMPLREGGLCSRTEDVNIRVTLKNFDEDWTLDLRLCWECALNIYDRLREGPLAGLVIVGIDQHVNYDDLEEIDIIQALEHYREV